MGTIHGDQIELDEAPSLPDGTRVQFNLVPEEHIRRGSPQAVLQLAGTLGDEEVEAILTVVRELRHVAPA